MSMLEFVNIDAINHKVWSDAFDNSETIFLNRETTLYFIQDYCENVFNFAWFGSIVKWNVYTRFCLNLNFQFCTYINSPHAIYTLNLFENDFKII